MQKLDKVALAQSISFLLVAGAIGCGDDSKPATKLDGGVDHPSDVATMDTGRADTPSSFDVTKPDVPEQEDTATLDAAPPQDTDEPALDTGPLDTAGTLDGVVDDVAQTLDTSAGEVSTVDGARATTTATITFELANMGTQTVFLRSECWMPITVTSLADGASYTNQCYCMCNCADSTCMAQVVCGVCASPSGIPHEPGKTKNISWTARKSTFQKKAGPAGEFQCVAHAPIATGDYKAAVVVYPTEADAAAESNGKTVEHSFVLGTNDATVVVPVP